jgi:lysophospholipase L1-like esterase
MTPLRVWLAAASALALTAPLAAESPDGFFFKKGDRVVFLGDSITEQYQYSTDIELYLTTRFPRWNLTFLNAGIGGDTAAGGSNRFKNQVLAEKPTVVTIDFGMNDGGYGAFDKARADNYVRNTQNMLEMAKQAGVRVALIAPNAVEVRSRQNLKTYLDTQEKFYAPLAELAKKYDVPFVDQYAVTRKVLEKMAEDNANVRPFPDGIHTNGAGGLLMAHTILVGLKAPALVSSVEIDAPRGNAKAVGCRVGTVEGTSDGTSSTRVSFERTDDALPMPLQKDERNEKSDCRLILPYLNHLNDLNNYGLKVTGLAPGQYAVRIDGTEVAKFSADQLAEGVNLGNLTTGPIYEQGQKVFQAIQAKNKSLHERFSKVVRFDASRTPDWLIEVAQQRRAEELAKRMEQIDARQAEIYRMVQPKPHRFEVSVVR